MPIERRAAVLGSPVDHSLSPVLHSAAYAALGLAGWTYTRLDCDEPRLPGLVAELGPEWAGLSVTMPGKRAALAVAVAATERAWAVGAANTLVHQPDGTWHADCTDVAGVIGALRAAGLVVPGAGVLGSVVGQIHRHQTAARAHPSPVVRDAVFADGGAEAVSETPVFGGVEPASTAVVLGAGGTACAALAAFSAMGIASATVVVRDPARAADAVDCAGRLSLPLRVAPWSTVDFDTLADSAAVLVNTAPAAATEPLAKSLARAAFVLDVIYHPWPTPVADAVARAGGRLATGLDMLLHQAFDQVEQFTGHPAPREPMRDALWEATGGVLPLPL
ncbi:shikimate dehydrogenase [Actinokineospora sp.]|uniref:shikimate dehydrogenase n=1 Tax=Actinokineospora sp. TaxID=1872133 RepID=UPI004038164B